MATGAMPDPLRIIACGDPLASSVTVIDPLDAPRVCGWYVAVIVQLLAASKVAPQFVLAEKPVPLTATPEMCINESPLLVSVAVCCSELPTKTLPKSSDDAERLATGAIPVPE